MNTTGVGSTGEEILLAALAVDWRSHGVQDPAEIVDAFVSLVHAPSPADVQAANNVLFDVLVHNHSGEGQGCRRPGRSTAGPRGGTEHRAISERCS